MNAVIDTILRENTEYYQRMKTILVGRLLVSERGSVKRKRVAGKTYHYLRKSFGRQSIETYIGTEVSPRLAEIEKKLKKKKNDQDELRQARDALKKLRAKNMHAEDFTKRIKDIFQLMESQGFWDEGLQLIGSWCFKIYQNYFGVAFYPERTVDIDFAIRLPYRGSPLKIGEKLINMGFQEDRNLSDGSIRYLSGEIMVEFVTQQEGDGRDRGDPYIPELDIAPQALPYLNILLERPVTRTFHGLGTVTVPSMPAFLIHKLVVVSKRRDPGKKEKDLRQAKAVAEALARDQELLDELAAVLNDLHKTRKKMVLIATQKADSIVPGASEAFLQVLNP